MHTDRIPPTGPDADSTQRPTGLLHGTVQGTAAAHAVGWRWKAACARPGVDPALFFKSDGKTESSSARQTREAAAKRICARCVVRDVCLSVALANREPHGVWGGLNELERQALEPAIRATPAA